jgi:hypothetical protein
LIRSDGVQFTGSLQVSGSTLAVTVDGYTTNDTSHDIYEVAYSYGNCTGTYAALNGVQFSGLATLNTSQSPPQLVMAVTGASASSKFGIVPTLSGD